MTPQVSFIVCNRGGDPIAAVWDALQRQDLPPDAVEIHIIQPAPEPLAELPPVTGRVVVILDAAMLPATDLARRALEAIDESPRAERSLIVGRVQPVEGSGHDPISTRLASASWCAFERITDPDSLPLRQFHTRCLCLSAQLYDACRGIFSEFILGSRQSDARLAARLIATGNAALRFRPGLVVHPASPFTLAEWTAGVRQGATDFVHFARTDPAAATELDSASGELTESILDLEAALDRLLAIAGEIGRLDLAKIARADAPELAIAARVTQMTDLVLAAILRTAQRLGRAEGAASPAGAAPVITAPPATASPSDIRERPYRTIEIDAGPAGAPDDVSIALSGDGIPTRDTISASSAKSTAPVSEAPSTSIVIIATSAEKLGRCLNAIATNTPDVHEIVVVDRGSAALPGDLASTHRVRETIRVPEPRGYAAAVNEGLRRCRGAGLVILEEEATPGPGWLEALREKLADDVGAVAAISNGLPGLQNLVRWNDDPAAIRDLGTLSARLRANDRRSQVVRHVQPLCVLIGRRSLDAIGGMEERLVTSDAAWMELAWRMARRELKTVVAGDAFVGRPDGLRLPAADRAGDLAADHRMLCDIVAGTGLDHVPDSRELWGVAWTGFDEREDPRLARSLSIVIPVHNQVGYTKRCIETLRAGSVSDFEIIVFDNGSTDGTRQYLLERSDVKALKSDRNLGFAPAVNRGIEASRGRFVLVLNNDVLVPRRMIERMLDVMSAHPEYGIIGPVTNESAPSQRVRVDYEVGYGIEMAEIERFADARWSQHGDTMRREVAVLGLAMLIRREVLDTAGIFDEQFEIGNFEDNDLSLRAAMAGFRVGVAEGIFIHHFGSRTFAGAGFDYEELMRRNHDRFLAKWKPSLSTGSASTPAGRPAIARDVTAPADAPAGWIPIEAAPPRAGAPPVVPEPEITAEELAPGALYLLANDRLEKNQLAGAIELFTLAIAKMPDLVLAHMGLGLALVRQGRPAEAVASLERCTALAPDFSEGHNNLGVLYQTMGRTADARRALERALELDPSNTSARENLNLVVDGATAAG